MQVTAYVALGANLGDPVATVRAAFTALRDIPETRLLAASSLYRSTPVGLRDQPDFINAVAALTVDAGSHGTSAAASAFLARLFTIEAAFGRVRSIKNAPRTLDLDLLLFGDLQCAVTGLSLPHPRLTERAFVLAPLTEIAPTLTIPGHGPVAALLSRITNQHIEKLI